ncbi:MAG: type I-D CRISPR-associated protein Cas5/Csc1 [Chloroflexi bacterium]|jgi:CRISPR-associated protein Csc1|nr:MAG: type I-D CRISPR-associated protein Cas5/Csc1 [Chloroflexota bacterium]
MKPINLADYGVRVFAGRMYNHDYLWFSSTEISKVSTALPVIHNYALTYALSAFSYAAYWGNTPRYKEDLMQMPLYATPAATESATRTKVTYNAIDSLSLRTDVGPSVNTPNLGWRVYLDPVYSRKGKSNAGKGYIFYAFVFVKAHTEVFGDSKPQSVFRLGKKGAPMRVWWQEIDQPVAVFHKGPIRPGHPINPLDVSGQVKAFDAINIPPHLLLRSAEIANDWFILDAGSPIHLPRTVRERVGI